MLRINDIHKSFAKHEVLKGISFDVDKGDVIAIIGPSGSGKTTLLRCINFLERADSGSMDFDELSLDFATVSKSMIYAVRKKTGFVFQNYNLFQNKTALENVTEGLIVARKIEKKRAVEIARQTLDKVGLSDKYDSYPSQLSGGQQQRVGIARALALNPSLILLDEPTSSLDPELVQEVLKVIRELVKEKITMLIVTHEINFAKEVANKLIFIDDGRIVEEGETLKMLESPKEARTIKFLKGIGLN